MCIRDRARHAGRWRRGSSRSARFRAHAGSPRRARSPAPGSSRDWLLFAGSRCRPSRRPRADRCVSPPCPPSRFPWVSCSACGLAHFLIQIDHNTIHKRTQHKNAAKQSSSKQRDAAEERQGMVKKIALEEHFLCPGFEDYWKTTVGNVDPAIYRHVVARLSEFGELRLEDMDRAGIARAVLSLAGPGVQVERDTKTAIRKAQEALSLIHI